MVHQIIWTEKAIISYARNIEYLEERWTDREIKLFTAAIERKLAILITHPDIGTSRNKRHPHIRHTLVHKRVTLIYKVIAANKTIELIWFWNNYQDPRKLSGVIHE